MIAYDEILITEKFYIEPIFHFEDMQSRSDLVD